MAVLDTARAQAVRALAADPVRVAADRVRAVDPASEMIQGGVGEVQVQVMVTAQVDPVTAEAMVVVMYLAPWVLVMARVAPATVATLDPMGDPVPALVPWVLDMALVFQATANPDGSGLEEVLPFRDVFVNVHAHEHEHVYESHSPFERLTSNHLPCGWYLIVQSPSKNPPSRCGRGLGRGAI